MIKERKPAHPGRILKNMYLKPLNLTITKLADTLNVYRKSCFCIVTKITPRKKKY